MDVDKAEDEDETYELPCVFISETRCDSQGRVSRDMAQWDRVAATTPAALVG